MQKRRIAVDLVGIGRIDLEIAEQMSNHIAEENQARYGHDYLLADGGVIEANCPVERD